MSFEFATLALTIMKSAAMEINSTATKIVNDENQGPRPMTKSSSFEPHGG
jgi:hypothetical protein